MSFFNSMNISATGLGAQRTRMDIHAQNLANVDTTRTADGGPYRRRAVIFEERTAGSSFAGALSGAIGQTVRGGGRGDRLSTSLSSSFHGSINRTFAGSGLPFRGIAGGDMGGAGVRVHSIQEDDSPGPRVFDPGHPDADVYGYVERPNVNTIAEMVNMISATRSYEANMTAMNMAQTMMQRTLELSGR
ncbi:MAG: flagellar basal body rod protein FlgC [Defluviitaleaceae bacterium]|nr:flagellar basal body rod protein FlgC [Defluviitaleaceae bacterium]